MVNKTTSRAIALELAAVHHGIDLAVVGISPLNDPVSGHLTFVTDPMRAAEQVSDAIAKGAVLLFPQGEPLPEMADAAVLVVDNPRVAFAQAVSAFFAPQHVPGISPDAFVHPTAEVAASASVGHFSVIGEGVVIGDLVEIRHHVVIGPRVRIGDASLIKSHAVIGEEGFGIDKDETGNNLRLPHLGSVILGDHVEVGNFTTVCSGTIAPTVVGHHSKIDDHVHIAHNCRVGANVIVTACAEISGSVTMGDDVWVGPNASILQGLTIGAHALVGIGAVVTKSIPANEVQFGNPSRRIRDNT